MRWQGKGTGKTGRINPSDVRYYAKPRNAVALPDWAKQRLMDMAAAQKKTMAQYMSELIENASMIIITACWTLGLAALMARAWDQ